MQVKSGLFPRLKILEYFNTPDKRSVLGYSIAWFGFLPILALIFIVPAFGDISHYFLYPELARAQGLFEQYRVTLAPLLILPTIMAISRFKLLNNKK